MVASVACTWTRRSRKSWRYVASSTPGLTLRCRLPSGDQPYCVISWLVPMVLVRATTWCSSFVCDGVLPEHAVGGEDLARQLVDLVDLPVLSPGECGTRGFEEAREVEVGLGDGGMPAAGLEVAGLVVVQGQDGAGEVLAGDPLAELARRPRVPMPVDRVGDGPAGEGPGADVRGQRRVGVREAARQAVAAGDRREAAAVVARLPERPAIER